MNKVLFVDDEILVLNSIKRGLISEDYEKYFATSGEEALEIMSIENISVLVTDMKMPGISGLDLLKKAKVLYPDMVKIVLSGYTHLPQVLVTINQGDIFKFITKPWDMENEFKAVVREAIEHYNRRVKSKETHFEPQANDLALKIIIKTYDEKLKAIKDEMTLIKALNKYELKKSKEFIMAWDSHQEDRSVLMSKLEIFSDVMSEALEIFPLHGQEFATKSLIENFKKNMVLEKSLKHYEFGMDNKTPELLHGYYDLLFFVLKKVSQVFFIESFDTQVDIILSGEHVDADTIILKILMKSKQNNFKHGLLQEAVLAWLSQMLSHIGGVIDTKEFGGAKALIIGMPFKQ